MESGHDGASELLDTCYTMPLEHRQQVLQALGQFPLGPQVWADLGPKIIALVDDAGVESPQWRGLVRTAASLPLDGSVRPLRWQMLLEQEPESSVSVEIATQLADLARNPLGYAAEALACLPIEEHDVAASAFANTLTAESADIRLWAAIAVARLGALQVLNSVLDELAAGQRVPAFLEEDRESAYGRLARVQPLPESVRQHLLRSPHRDDRHVDLLVWAVTGTRDVSGNPITAEAPLIEAELADTAVHHSDVVGQLLSDDALNTSAWNDDADQSWVYALQHTDHQVAGQVVMNLVEQIAAGDGGEGAADRLMEVVSALPDRYVLDVHQSVQWFSHNELIADDQMAFLLSRADLDNGLTTFSQALRDSHDDVQRVHNLELLNQAAQMSALKYGPVRVGQPPQIPAADFGSQLRGTHVWERERLVVQEPPGAERAAPRSERGVFTRIRDRIEGMFGGGKTTASSAEQPVAESGDRVRPSDSPPRSVHADVFLVPPPVGGSVIPVDKAFVRDRRHTIKVWIGHRSAASSTTIRSLVSFDDELVRPEPGSSTRLQVTVAHGEEAQTETLHLPNDRALSSASADFEFSVGDVPHVEMTVTVSQHNRILQQLRLRGPAVGPTDEAPSDSEIEMVPEVLARSNDDSAVTPVDVSVSRPSSGPNVLICNERAEVVLPWAEGIRTTVDVIAAELYDAGKSIAADGEDDAWPDLLRVIAAQGTQLHSWLKSNGYAALTDAHSIQLMDADPTEPLPIEIVYDGPRLADDAVACPNWAQALETGSCEVCADAAATAFRSPYICPLSFWGLTKVIERSTGTEPVTPGSLQPLTTVLFAASTNVRDDDYEATVSALTDAFRGSPATVDTWEVWKDSVSQHQPTLMVVLPHQDVHAKLKVDYLQIGDASELRSGELTADMVRCAGGPAPVVLLLGCRTANASVSYHNFIADFRSNGAPIVLGTLATVLGRDAAAIAQEFVRALAATRAKGITGQSMSFGETMRSVRRQMVARQNAAALGLIAFGDSDWRLDVGA